RLPDSELLKAVHGYAADFYKRAIDGGGKGDWRSLDETALLAVGVLLEEGARECLGGSGDLVFVEGEDGGVGLGPGLRESRSVVGRSEAARKSGVTRRKRRKVDMDDGERGDG
ncbi:MAG: hypothetical protein M1830_010084, partial [Pleopsidium flavum]